MQSFTTAINPIPTFRLSDHLVVDVNVGYHSKHVTHFDEWSNKEPQIQSVTVRKGSNFSDYEEKVEEVVDDDSNYLIKRSLVQIKREGRWWLGRILLCHRRGGYKVKYYDETVVGKRCVESHVQKNRIHPIKM